MFSRWRAQRATAPHLMRYWDELVNGEGSHYSQEGLDTPLQDTVRQVHERYDAQAADPVFSEQLLEDLMQTYQLAEVSQMTALRKVAIPLSETNNSPSAGSIDWPERRNRVGRREALAAIGAAAVLLIGVLAGGYFWIGSEPEPPAVIPAFVAQSDDDEVESTTLLDITFPPGELRAEEGSMLIFAEAVMKPGSSLQGLSRCEPDDLLLHYVRSGTMTVDVVGESHILRAGQTEWETIAGGTVGLAGAGDTWLYRSYEIEFTGISNHGQEDMHKLDVIWANNPECSSAGPPTGERILWNTLITDGEVDASQPVRLVLRTVTAAPGVELPAEGPGALWGLTNEQKELGMRQWAAIESGTLEVGHIPVLPDDVSPSSTFDYSVGKVFTEDYVFMQADSRIVFKSVGDEPLELTILDVITGEPEALGGAPSP